MPSEEVIRQFNSDLDVLEIDKGLAVRRTETSFVVEIRWSGFTSKDDTEEPIETVLDDEPIILKIFLQSN